MWYFEYPSTENMEAFPFFLRSIGLHECQPEIHRSSGHPYDQFFYSEHGCGEVVIDGKKYISENESAFFIPANIPHSYKPMSEDWDIRWMVPDGKALPDIYSRLNLTGGVYRLICAGALDQIMNRMHNELIHDRVMGNIAASACVMEYLVEFARQTGVFKSSSGETREESDVYEHNMNILKNYIDQHFAENITMEKMCGLIDVTPQHLCRIFKHCSGMRPMEYIRHHRIELAKKIMESSGESTSEIAHICGFENDNYFWKSFKQIVKMTPNEYREKFGRK
jgi:AraC-like DNA-binding protein